MLPVSRGDKKKQPPNILDRNLLKSKSGEVSLSAFAFLFSEMLQYSQKRCTGVSELEKKLSTLGQRVGIRYLELLLFRDRNNKRDTKILQLLMFVHSVVWKGLFGKVADSLEKSTENEDEYMITDNAPFLTSFIYPPRELSSFNANSFVAGILESILEGCGFPAKVTAHSIPMDGFPLRTTMLIKFNQEVLAREKELSGTR